MTDELVETAVSDTTELELKRFGKLPVGYQRVVIAALFVAVLAAAVLLRQMINTEETVRQGEQSAG